MVPQIIRSGLLKKWTTFGIQWGTVFGTRLSFNFSNDLRRREKELHTYGLHIQSYIGSTYRVRYIGLHIWFTNGLLKMILF